MTQKNNPPQYLTNNNNNMQNWQNVNYNNNGARDSLSKYSQINNDQGAYASNNNLNYNNPNTAKQYETNQNYSYSQPPTNSSSSTNCCNDKCSR
jgi:hypothetical protein